MNNFNLNFSTVSVYLVTICISSKQKQVNHYLKNLNLILKSVKGKSEFSNNILVINS